MDKGTKNDLQNYYSEKGYMLSPQGRGQPVMGCGMYPRRKDVDINLTSIMEITYNLILSHKILT
jgi:hypothetical protein